MRIRYLISAVLSLYSFVALASAQELIPLAGNDNSATVQIPAGSPIRQLTFWYISRGKISLPVVAGIAGPAGMTAEMDARELKGSAETPLRAVSNWQKLSLSVPLRTTAVSVDLAAKAAPAAYCGSISEQQYVAWLEAHELPDTPDMRLLACEIMYIENSQGGGGGQSPVNNGSQIAPPGYESAANTIAQIRKNTCTNDKAYKTLVRLKVSLSGVDPAKFAAGFSVLAAIKEYSWQASMAASIKPISDGKFYPSPIVMMVAIAGDAKINVFQWKNGLPRLLKTLPVNSADNFGRMGLPFSRTRVNSVLRGGYGIFEMNNGADAYSVCFKLVRSRQRVNGFK